MYVQFYGTLCYVYMMIYTLLNHFWHYCKSCAGHHYCCTGLAICASRLLQ